MKIDPEKLKAKISEYGGIYAAAELAGVSSSTLYKLLRGQKVKPSTVAFLLINLGWEFREIRSEGENGEFAIDNAVLYKTMTAAQVTPMDLSILTGIPRGELDGILYLGERTTLQTARLIASALFMPVTDLAKWRAAS